MRGSHLITHWCRTQQCVALSSCEAELNGICKASAEGLGAKNLSVELGVPEDLILRTDASAAVGVIQRQGAGKVKHLQVKQLWVQELERSKEIAIKKVSREVNWSDMLTHHWTANEGERMMAGMSLIRRGPGDV